MIANEKVLCMVHTDPLSTTKYIFNIYDSECTSIVRGSYRSSISNTIFFHYKYIYVYKIRKISLLIRSNAFILH